MRRMGVGFSFLGLDGSAEKLQSNVCLPLQQTCVPEKECGGSQCSSFLQGGAGPTRVRVCALPAVQGFVTRFVSGVWFPTSEEGWVYPVSPEITTTWWSRIASAISSRAAEIGNLSSYVIPWLSTALVHESLACAAFSDKGFIFGFRDRFGVASVASVLSASIVDRVSAAPDDFVSVSLRGLRGAWLWLRLRRRLFCFCFLLVFDCPRPK